MLKHKLITHTALELRQPEAVVEKVVTFQYRDAAKAAHVHNEIEISGFGKFLISQAKVKRRQQRHQEMVQAIEAALPTADERKREGYLLKLQGLQAELAFYEQKLSS